MVPAIYPLVNHRKTIGKPEENHRKTVTTTGKWWFYGILWDLPSGNETLLAGKSPRIGGFRRKITDRWSIFQQAMFDYQRVLNNSVIVGMGLWWPYISH